MLVLSRRPNEKILFPTLGVTVEIVSVARNVVRVGIDAPASIPILREELATEAMKSQASTEKSMRHSRRNRMHTASLAVHLAQKQLQAGLIQDANASLNQALREFAALEEEMAAAVSPAPRRELRALVVEDNQNERTLLAEFLKLHGIKVETACDGQDALDYLRSHDRPDVILLDMRMPRCDGPTTIAAIRGNADYEGLKVFAVSGVDPTEIGIAPGDRGVDGWFTKPVDPAKLVHQMNRALGLN